MQFHYRGTLSTFFLFERHTGNERSAPCNISPLTIFVFPLSWTRVYLELIFNFLTCFRTRRERMSVKWRPTWRNRRWGVLQMPDLCSVVLKSSCAQLGLNEWTTACGLFCADLKNVFFGSLQEPSNKRVKPVAKSNSLTGVLNPVKTPALKRIGQSISVTNTLAVQSYKVTSEWVLGFCISQLLLSVLSGLSVFVQKLDLCPQPPCVHGQRPPRFHVAATASVGVTLWKVTIWLQRKSNGKRCAKQKPRY